MTTSRRGSAVWPTLTIESSHLDAHSCMMEGVSDIQPWGVLRWMEAVRAAPELHMPDGWKAEVGWCITGIPALTLCGPTSYLRSRIWSGSHDREASLSDVFERREVTLEPRKDGAWGMHRNGSWTMLQPAELAHAAQHATTRTWGGSPPPGELSLNGPAVFVLGSRDVEMEAIEEVLRKARRRFVWGTKNGKRLAPGQDAEMDLPKSFQVMGVECAVNGLPAVFDHHGDRPEASAPPERSWWASSLGQVWRHVHGEAEPPLRLRVIAAVDHCLAAACLGLAGVPKGHAIAQAMEGARLTFGGGMDREAFLEVAQTAMQTLTSASPALDLCPDGHVADLRHLPLDGPIVEATGEQYPAAFQFGPVVGSICGRGYVVKIRRRDGRLALRVGGCGEGTRPGPGPIVRWLEGVGELYGCLPVGAERPSNLYGSPARGYAGGTLRED